MPRASSSILFAIAIALFLSAAAQSFADPYTEAVRAAQYDLEAAKLEYRLYRNVEYPRQSRQLRFEVDRTEAQIDQYRRRDRKFRRYSRHSTSNPFSVSAEWNRLALLESEHHLNELQRDRSARSRYRSDEIRLRGMRVYAAEARLLELTGGEPRASATGGN